MLHSLGRPCVLYHAALAFVVIERHPELFYKLYTIATSVPLILVSFRDAYITDLVGMCRAILKAERRRLEYTDLQYLLRRETLYTPRLRVVPLMRTLPVLTFCSDDIDVASPGSIVIICWQQPLNTYMAKTAWVLFEICFDISMSYLDRGSRNGLPNGLHRISLRSIASPRPFVVF
jgi:hypothetical protein